jgi:DNA helicase II / ATP-dependent DNA helicase PcrA
MKFLAQVDLRPMKQKIDYSRELNPVQLEAVQSTEGPYLVIAGAGSGKTRVLVYRVAYLVEKGVRPDEILLLTFTRKAAQEMLRRASLLLDERCSQVSGGTFHSFANMTLRRYARVLGIPNSFSILDESDAQDTVNLVRTHLGFHKLKKRFPRKAAILDIISKSINKSCGLDEVLYGEYPQFMEYAEELKKIRDGYSKYKRLKGLLDYDDLLVYLKGLLVKHEDVRMRLSSKYKYIMLDEYQDTNKLQAHIACLLASAHKNIMAVGDDAQSIYSFRGANFKNIIDFPKIFKEAKIITLEENYRSTQSILNLGNALISQAKEKFEKNLYTKKKAASLPVFIEAEDENSQSKYVADKILELREEGIELSDIAVLFRSGWHSNDLEIELSSRNIPFVKYGGQKFAQAAHIKDVLSYLRIGYNLFDEVCWLRALLLIGGIGPKTAQAIINEVIINKKGIDMDPGVFKKSDGLIKLFELLRDIDKEKLSPGQMLHIFLEYYQPLLKEKYDDFNKRLNDLDSLERIASRYKSLEQFLSDMALEPPERGVVTAGLKDNDDSRVTLSTIHSAKGLEWHTVFLLYVAEGHLPSYLSLENEDAVEEELRLFYVAATRAKENLFLLKPHIDRGPKSFMDEGGSVFTQVSRFLDRDNILKKLMNIEYAGNVSSIGEIGPDRDFLDTMKEYF